MSSQTAPAGWSDRPLPYLLAQDVADAQRRRPYQPTRETVARVVRDWLGNADAEVEAAVCRSLAGMHVRFVR